VNTTCALGGSTFKVVTAADLIEHALAALGLTLPGTTFLSVAAQFGPGVQPDVGRPAYGGTVAAPTSRYDQAETASDGGSTTASPQRRIWPQRGWCRRVVRCPVRASGG